MIDPTYGFIYQTDEDIVNNADNVSFPDFSAGGTWIHKKYVFWFCCPSSNST